MSDTVKLTIRNVTSSARIFNDVESGEVLFQPGEVKTLEVSLAAVEEIKSGALAGWSAGEKLKVKKPETLEEAPVEEAVEAPVEEIAEAPVEVVEKLTRSELSKMTKDELTEHAEDLGIDVGSGWTKSTIIDAVVFKQRRD